MGQTIRQYDTAYSSPAVNAPECLAVRDACMSVNYAGDRWSKYSSQQMAGTWKSA